MRVDLALESSPGAPAQARRALVALDRCIPYDRLADVQTIVTELVTNGVKYGPGEPIDVHVWLDDGDAVEGWVGDHGAGSVEARADTDPGAGQGGLGLRIIDRIADAWGTREGSSDVWFRLAL
ncbi:MAG TPA: ATP-binding protein [Solirubrobacterales bacterium]|nr:ATP-binding protein [Solirubrobacterales bacterium]